MKPISYEPSGFPEFLRSVSACEKAIARGALKPDTPIVAYGENGARDRMLAKEHPLLKELLGLEEAPEPEPNPPAEIEEQDPVEPSTPAKGTRGPGPTVTSKPSREEVARPSVQEKHPGYALPADPTSVDAGEHKETEPEPGPPEPGIAGKVALGIIGLVTLIFLISQCSSDNSEFETDPYANSGYEAPAEAATEAPQEQTQYAMREIAVRSQPSGESRRITLMPRGSAFTGVVVPSVVDPQYTWLRITSGNYRNYYVSTSNLASDPRPTLDTSVAGFWYLNQAYTAKVAPSDSAADLTDAEWRLPSGAQLDVAGVTGDGILSSGWAEVMLPKNAGVGYIPMDLLSQPDNTAAQMYAGRKLALRNNCRNDIFLIVRLQTTDGWKDVAVTIAPQSTAYARINGVDVGLSSNEVYFASLYPGDRRDFTTDVVRISDYGLRGNDLKTMNVGTGSNGEYLSNFSC